MNWCVPKSHREVENCSYWKSLFSFCKWLFSFNRFESQNWYNSWSCVNKKSAQFLSIIQDFCGNEGHTAQRCCVVPGLTRCSLSGKTEKAFKAKVFKDSEEQIRKTTFGGFASILHLSQKFNFLFWFFYISQLFRCYSKPFLSKCLFGSNSWRQKYVKWRFCTTMSSIYLSAWFTLRQV